MYILICCHVINSDMCFFVMTTYQNVHIETIFDSLLHLLIFFSSIHTKLKHGIGESSLLFYGLNPFGIKKAHENIFLICVIQALVIEVT